MSDAWCKEEITALTATLGPEWVITRSRPHYNVAWRLQGAAPWFAKVFKWKEPNGELFYGLEANLLVSGSACRTIGRLARHIEGVKNIEVTAKRDIALMFVRCEPLDHPVGGEG